jgi:uroporphyrinogen-III synthase
LLGENDLRRIFRDISIACLGKTTAQAARENDLQVDVIAAQANMNAFATAIEEFYR